MISKSLRLYEEILLLALDDEQGTIGRGSLYAQAMGGAILADLAMTRAVTIADDKKKTVRMGAGATPTDPILSEALGKVRDASKPKPAKDWVLKFAGLKDLKNRAARQLAARGILNEESDQVMILFRRTVFPERDGGPERALRQRLADAVFTEAPNVEPRTVVVLALLKATKMLDKVLGKREVKERKARLEKLLSGEATGKATREAVEAMQAAVFVCTVVPAVVVTST